MMTTATVITTGLIVIVVTVVMQVWMMMKVFDVQKNRMKVAIWTICYSVLFLTVEYIMGIDCARDPNALSSFISELWHTLYTFVIIGSIAVFSEGNVFRNFIKLFFYYDVFTILTGTIVIIPVILKVTGAPYEDLMYYPAYQESMVPALAYMIVQTSLVILASWLFDKYLDRLVKKIPEIACKVVMIAAFVTYLITWPFKIADPAMTDKMDPSFYLMGILFICICTLLYFIIKLGNTNRLYDRMLSVEKGMQYRHYETVMTIYRKVREFRHDLLNHITVFRNLGSYDDEEKRAAYEMQIERFCTSVEEEIGQRKRWELLAVDRLSSREKYEIYEYLGSVAEKSGTSIDDVSFNVEGDRITAFVPSGLRASKVKRGDHFRMINVMAAFSGLRAEWSRKDDGLVFTMEPRQEG